MMVIAHGGLLMGPHDLPYAWTLHPLVLAAVIGACWWYLRGVRSLWRSAGRGGVVSKWQVAAFSAAIVAISFALVSPLDALSSALFSAHMVQHLLLTLVAAPLLVMSSPLQAMAWGLPSDVRRRTGLWHGRLRRLLAQPALPAVGLALFTLVFTLWHVPALYNASLASEAVHATEHITMLAFAVAFWAPIVRPRRTHAGLGVLLLALSLIASGVLAALLVFAPTPWYAHAATQDWGLTALEDQQLAGAVMWIFGGGIYVAAGAVVVMRWLWMDEEAVLRWERRRTVDNRV